MYDVVVIPVAPLKVSVVLKVGVVDICMVYVFVPTLGDVEADHENVCDDVLLIATFPFAGDDNVGQDGTGALTVIVKPVVGVAPDVE